jgi:RND family efflux transporter MFP subunit
MKASSPTDNDPVEVLPWWQNSGSDEPVSSTDGFDVPESQGGDETLEVQPPRSRRTARRVAACVMLLGAGLVGLYKFGQRPRMEAKIALDAAARQCEERPPAVNVVQPVLAPGTTELLLPGETRSFYETTVFARVNGYLSHWLVDIGDRVKEGQLLATIETPELDQQLAESKAQVGALEAQVRLAEAQLNFARISLDRFNAVACDGAVSTQERDQKEAEHKTAVARLEAAKAQLELGKATVRRFESEIAFKRVVAPFSGVITERHIDVGSLITAGSTVNTTSLFAVAQSDTIRVFVKVPQTASLDIKVGMSASVTAREFPGRVFAGTVDRTASAIDPLSRTLKVEVLVPNPDLVLLPGMYVDVRFAMVRRHPPYLIDAAAMNLRTEGPEVAVVDGDDRVRFRKIKVARDLGTSIEVADGLRGGERLAVNISTEIADGERVRPVPLSSSVANVPNTASGSSGAGSPLGAAKVVAEGSANGARHPQSGSALRSLLVGHGTSY